MSTSIARHSFITKTLPAIHAEMKRLERKAGDDGNITAHDGRHEELLHLRGLLDPDLALLTGAQA